MNKIIFENFDIDEKRITFDLKTIENEEINIDNIYFEFNQSNYPSNDSIAIALSTLCGTNYDEIYIDLEISDKILNNIADFTKSNVSVKNTVPEVQFNKEGRNVLLNFSGGFDSLAAKCILPNSKLISIDFGGWFERETEFFKRFSPYTVKTNFRQLKYDANSWTFMGVGSVLYKDTLGGGYNVFGTNLDSTPYNFFQRFSEKDKEHPFDYLNLDEIKVIRGLSGVVTTMIVTYYKPELVNDALVSLSNPKTEKRYRKQLYAEVISRKYNRNIFIEKTEPPIKPIEFGKMFGPDFRTFWIIKNCGLKESEKLVVNTPDEIIDICEKYSLDFYEKYNPNYLTKLPQDIRNHVINRLSEASVYPYNERDWKEFNIVRDYLSNYYNVMKKLHDLEN